jgi:membrane protein implicated in regulation of membrane protease activity
MMQTIYWFCALVGGGFVLLSALGGLDGPNFDMDWDSDVEWVDPNKSRSQHRLNRRGLRFAVRIVENLRSIKFWTFGTCFFGLTGLTLTYTQAALSTTLILLIALGMGFGMGITASSLLLMMRRRQVNSLIQPDELVGVLGSVEVPFDRNSRGKIRIQLKDSIMEFSAFTNDPKPLKAGEQVVVISMENNRVWVVSDETLRHLNSDSSTE